MTKFTIYFRNPQKAYALERETISAAGVEDARAIYANAGMLIESVEPAVTAFDPGYFTAEDEADRQAEINFARYGG